MSARLAQLAESAATPVDDFSAVRRRAAKALLQHGFPDLKTEAWKYTSLRLLDKREFVERSASPSSAPELPFDSDRLHIDNGLLAADGLELPAGVRLEPLTAADLAAVEYAGRSEAFAWLNLARFQQAWRLCIEAELDRPLVLALTSADDFQADAHPRLVIEVGAGVAATLVECQHDRGAGLINIVQDIRLGAGARLDHFIHRQTAESVWVQRTAASVAADADYRCHVLDTGGRLTRHDLSVELIEAGARAEIDGVALVGSRQHVDVQTAIDHRVGRTNSREAFRILADGSGVGVFRGRIHIARGADDSHSDLNTANLLLSDSARINTKPELEIYAEEVTASHGATIGQLDESALFYLRSRGVPAAEAAALLKRGFASAPLDNIESDPLRAWLISELNARLGSVES